MSLHVGMEEFAGIGRKLSNDGGISDPIETGEII